MFDDLLATQDGKNTPFAFCTLTLRRSRDSLAPDISQITVAALRPLRSASFFDIQAAVEGHAVRRGVGTVDGGLSLLAHRGTVTLSGQEHRMDLGFYATRDGIRDEKGQKGYDSSRIDIPLTDERAQPLVELCQEAAETHSTSSSRSLSTELFAL